jgi:hypothetical protein
MNEAVTDQNELRLNMHKREWWCARPTKAERSDKVSVRGRQQRHMSYMEIRGEREDVLDHVAYLIAQHEPQFMYEHMAIQVDKIYEADGMAVAVLSQSLYAGD